jgi:hypothetical protein
MGRGGGLLSKGTPLSWNDSLKWLAHVRAHGIIQFINTFNHHRHREADTFRWGDEVCDSPLPARCCYCSTTYGCTINIGGIHNRVCR